MTDQNAPKTDWMDAFGRFVLRWRWLIVVVTLLQVVAVGAGLQHVAFNPDSRLFFGKENPDRILLDRIEDTYSRANNVVFVLAPRDGNVFTATTLQAIEDLTEESWQIPHVFDVDSLSDYAHSYAIGDDIFVEHLYEDAAALSAEEVQDIREIALGTPEILNLLVSDAGDVTSVAAFVNQSQDTQQAVPEIVASARALADAFRAEHPDIDVYMTGGIMADMAFAEAAERDMTELLPYLVLLSVGVLWIGLRAWTGVFATVAVVLVSVVTAIGAASWAGVVFNTASASAPIIVLTLCVADCVHFFVTYSSHGKKGDDKQTALLAALRLNFAPIFITSLTSAIGFMTLNFSDSPPFRDLGNIVALGIVAGFVYSVTFLPALLAVLPATSRRGPLLAPGTMAGLARFVTRHKLRVVLLSGIVFVGTVAGMDRLVLDDDFIDYFDDSFAFRRDTDFMQNRLTGLHVLLYSLPAGGEGDIAEPDYLRAIERAAEWFRSQEHVSHVYIHSDMIKRLHMTLNGDDPAYRTIPDARDLAAQILLLYELSLPSGESLSNSISVDRSSTLMVVRLSNVSSADIRRIGLAGEAWLQENTPEIAARASGLSMVYAYISKRNVESMLIGTFVALVLISGLLFVVLRSLSIGLISLVPNLVPALLTFGLWGYLEGEVTLAVSVVGAMTLGIVVDDTVHFLNRYLWARRKLGLGPTEAVEHSMSSVGVALVVTSVALVTGFAMLAFSGFTVTWQMGLMSAVTITVALITDLILLPALLLTIHRERQA